VYRAEAQRQRNWGIVIERTHGWNGRSPRHRKDYERKAESSAALIEVRNSQLMLRRLTGHLRSEFITKPSQRESLEKPQDNSRLAAAASSGSRPFEAR
jgi:hypothetical protein